MNAYAPVPQLGHSAVMRWLMAAVSVVAMLGGCSFVAVRGHSSRGANCTSSRVAPSIDTIVAAVSAVAAIGGLIYAANMQDGEDADVPGFLLAITAGPLSLPFAASAIYGQRVSSACSDLQSEQRKAQLRAEDSARARIRDRIRDRAESATRQAADAARAGDCEAVAHRDVEVRGLDPDFHAGVFVRDAEIKKCLDERARLDDWRHYYAEHAPAAAITRQAAERARAGDCAAVVNLDREIRELDAEFHAGVFVRDVGIRQCLDAASSASEQPAVSP